MVTGWDQEGCLRPLSFLCGLRLFSSEGNPSPETAFVVLDTYIIWEIGGGHAKKYKIRATKLGTNGYVYVVQ